MRDPQAERNAMRSMAAMRLETETSGLYLEFTQQAKFPEKLRSRLFDDRELYKSEHVESIFRRAYPAFPFLVGVVPPTRTKEMTSIKKLFDKAGPLQKVYDECAARNSRLISEMVLAMLVRVPYSKEIWLLHNHPWSKPSGDLVVFSYENYFLTFQPMRSFMNSALGDFVTEYIANALAGSY